MSTNVKLYIGTELADFDEKFNVMFSIGDIREISFGNSNKSYTLNLPLTKQNKRLLKFITQVDVKTEQDATGRLYIGEQLIISGPIQVTGYSDNYAKIVVTSDDWIDALKDKKMTDLEMGAWDHYLNNANVEDSWSAVHPYTMYRYPMIDFGGVQSGEAGALARWLPTDFIPMISVYYLVSKILEPYTISSAWLAIAGIKDLYILGKETIAPAEFIQKKGLEVKVQNATDNEQSGTSSTTITVTFSKQLDLSTTITDEGLDWVGNRYVIPETGTYRFVGSVKFSNSAYGNTNLTITNETVLVYIDNTGVEVKRTQAGAYSGTELIHNITYAIDSYYVHFTAGDVISLKVFVECTATINTPPQTILLNTTVDTTFEAIWGNANRYSGLNKVIHLEDYLPDMTQLDFLAAVRDLANLRFWMAKMNRTIYVEPWDSFLSATVIDLTSFIDFENIDTEIISQNYNTNIVLKFKDDSDKAFEEYLKTNLYGPGRKDITLTSLYAKAGTDYREHQFSTIVTGYCQACDFIIPQIYNVLPVYPYSTYDRKVGFNTRIVEWKGLTSGTWDYDGVSKATYPKIQAVDWATLYTSYWMKFLHYLDRGKILTVRMKITPAFLNQFYAVIGTATSEGFRPTYRIDINGIANYFFLQKITSDGIIAELELVLKT